MIFQCLRLVESWKADDIFSMLVDQIVHQHCVVKKKKKVKSLGSVSSGPMIPPQEGSRNADAVILEDEDTVGKQIIFLLHAPPALKRSGGFKNCGMLSLEAFISVFHISFLKAE